MKEEERDEIMKKLEEISEWIQGLNLAEYIEMVRSPRRMLVINFVSGLARGLGIAIGATVLGAIFLIILLDSGRIQYSPDCRICGQDYQDCRNIPIIYYIYLKMSIYKKNTD